MQVFDGGTMRLEHPVLLACTLKPHPMVEWRSPVWDALMSV